MVFFYSKKAHTVPFVLYRVNSSALRRYYAKVSPSKTPAKRAVER
jgi:hypothetical protein